MHHCTKLLQRCPRAQRRVRAGPLTFTCPDFVCKQYTKTTKQNMQYTSKHVIGHKEASRHVFTRGSGVLRRFADSASLGVLCVCVCVCVGSIARQLSKLYMSVNKLLMCLRSACRYVCVCRHRKVRGRVGRTVLHACSCWIGGRACMFLCIFFCVLAFTHTPWWCVCMLPVVCVCVHVCARVCVRA